MHLSVICWALGSQQSKGLSTVPKRPALRGAGQTPKEQLQHSVVSVLIKVSRESISLEHDLRKGVWEGFLEVPVNCVWTMSKG